MTYHNANLQDARIKETHDLIASDKVEGTRVYGPDDKHIGSIERVIIEKRSGRVAYAVLGFGGFLGLGEDHYPLPWAKLTYDEKLGGYRTDVTPIRSKTRRNITAPKNTTGTRKTDAVSTTTTACRPTGCNA